MKKIKFVFLNIIIIIFIAASLAFAAEVKKASTAIVPASAKAVSAVKPAPVPPPASPAPSSKVTPAVKPGPVQNQTQPAVAPVPAPAPVDNYSYNPSGKPDPFKPYIVVVDTTALKKQIVKKAATSIFPLQRAETEKYRVVGIAGDKDHRVAIAEDAAKKFYPLLNGTRIGLNNGKVVEIMADRVIVEEYENKKVKRIILKLRKN
jgi:type IV pilus assembly protein PilP